MNYSEIKWKIQFTCGCWTEQFQTTGAYWGSSRPISSPLLPGYFVPTSLRASISLRGNNLFVGHPAAAAAAKSFQSCPTLCDPTDGSPPGSPIPGILQARTLEWVAISSSNAWKWKVKVKSLSRVWLLVTPWTTAYQAPPSMGFFQARVGCHCLLWLVTLPLLRLSHEHLDRREWVFTQLISICLQWRRPGFDPPVGKIPWRREWLPTPVFLPGDSHGQRSLVGYSP